MVQKFSKLKIVVQQINFTSIKDLTLSQRADMMMMSLQNQPKIAQHLFFARATPRSRTLSKGQVQFLVKIEPEAKLSFS